MTDKERAEKTVREVFLWDLKGEIGKMARLGVPIEDRRAISERLQKVFELIREDERARV